MTAPFFLPLRKNFERGSTPLCKEKEISVSKREGGREGRGECEEISPPDLS
jgi:hypothetical protein